MAVVTGGSRGLGKGIALELAAAGVSRDVSSVAQKVGVPAEMQSLKSGVGA